MRRDEKFIDIAMRMASYCSDRGKYRLGAVVVQGGRSIVSLGHNYYHESVFGRTMHAEEVCMRRAHKARLTHATIYVAGYRIRNNKTLKVVKSRPCNKCQALLRKHGIAHAVWIDDEGKIVREAL